MSEEGYVEELAEKVYEGINDLGKLRDRCTFLLELYNNKFVSKKMNLVLFDDAIKHLLKISRVIQM
jgi:dynein heavy chain